MSKLPLLPALLVALAGCQSQRRSEAPIGSTSEVEHIEEESAPESATERPPANVVEARRRGFSGLFTESGQELDADTLLTHLAAADAICIGERHDSVDDHFAELAIVEGLLERRPMRGFSLGLGFEMVRIEFQRSLSAYARGSGTLLDLEKGIEFSTEWGFPIEYYAPLFDEARATGSDLIPLGVDREFTHEVAKKGLTGLSPERARQLPPEIDATSARHREIFDELMKGHPHGEEPVGESDTSELHERLYQAQLVWDESMADRAAAYLRDRAPNGKLVIIAGRGHCHYTAIPARLERRGFETISVLPVHAGDEPQRGDAPSASEAHGEKRELLEGDYDYHLVLDAK